MQQDITFSYTFDNTGVIEISLNSVATDDGAPFGMEVMLASRQHSGNKPRRNRMCKSLANLGEKGPAKTREKTKRVSPTIRVNARQQLRNLSWPKGHTLQDRLRVTRGRQLQNMWALLGLKRVHQQLARLRDQQPSCRVDKRRDGLLDTKDTLPQGPSPSVRAVCICHFFVSHTPYNVASYLQKTSDHEHEQQHINHNPPLALIPATGDKLLASHHIGHSINGKTKACPCSSASRSSLLHEAVVSPTDIHSSYQQSDHDQTHHPTAETQHLLLHLPK